MIIQISGLFGKYTLDYMLLPESFRPYGDLVPYYMPMALALIYNDKNRFQMAVFRTAEYRTTMLPDTSGYESFPSARGDDNRNLSWEDYAESRKQFKENFLYDHEPPSRCQRTDRESRTAPRRKVDKRICSNESKISLPCSRNNKFSYEPNWEKQFATTCTTQWKQTSTSAFCSIWIHGKIDLNIWDSIPVFSLYIMDSNCWSVRKLMLQVTDMFKCTLRKGSHWALQSWHLTYTISNTGSAILNENAMLPLSHCTGIWSHQWKRQRQRLEHMQIYTNICAFIANTHGWHTTMNQKVSKLATLRITNRGLPLCWQIQNIFRIGKTKLAARWQNISGTTKSCTSSRESQLDRYCTSSQQ